MAEQPASDIDFAESWVNVTEAADIFGYVPAAVARLKGEHELLLRRYPAPGLFALRLKCPSFLSL